jgi:hypothetical protein
MLSTYFFKKQKDIAQLRDICAMKIRKICLEIAKACLSSCERIPFRA